MDSGTGCRQHLVLEAPYRNTRLHMFCLEGIKEDGCSFSLVLDVRSALRPPEEEEAYNDLDEPRTGKEAPHYDTLHCSV